MKNEQFFFISWLKIQRCNDNIYENIKMKQYHLKNCHVEESTHEHHEQIHNKNSHSSTGKCRIQPTFDFF